MKLRKSGVANNLICDGYDRGSGSFDIAMKMLGSNKVKIKSIVADNEAEMDLHERKWFRSANEAKENKSDILDMAISLDVEGTIAGKEFWIIFCLDDRGFGGEIDGKDITAEDVEELLWD